MAIKDEIVGSNGYLRKVRDQYLLSSKEMADLAFKQYEQSIRKKITKKYVLDNTDDVLKGLFIAETQIFNARNSQILSSVIPYYYREFYNKGKYPETDKNMKRLETLFNQCKGGKVNIDYFMNEIADSVGPMMDVISFSQKQAAKSRVGNTLQNHLQTIFEKCDIQSSAQQQRDDGGTIMDFVIPDLESYKKMPDQVINIECQTTLKDRFRLTTGKSTDRKIKRYLATASGCGLVTDRDVHDFTIEKVKELIINNDVTLVVFDDVKKKINSMISKAYADEKELSPEKANDLKDLEDLLNKSNNKIISYHELVTRDIPSILLYWKNVPKVKK